MHLTALTFINAALSAIRWRRINNLQAAHRSSPAAAAVQYSTAP